MASAAAPTASDGTEPTLASTAIGVRVTVTRLALEPADAAWLTAVGIGEGEALTVLRRAPFGGPLHVVTSLDAELAIGEALARGIVVGAAP